MSLSLVANCTPFFSKKERSRGEEYFRWGKVKELAVDEDSGWATVSGENEYEVHIDWSRPEELKVVCDCPYSADHVTCKHIWATLLALEKRGLAPKDLLEITGILPAGDDDADSEPARADFGRMMKQVAKLATGKSASKPKPAAWQKELKEVASLVTHPVPRLKPQKRRQVVYVIDVPASQESGQLELSLLQQEQKRNGEWGRFSRFAFDDHNRRHFLDGEDGHLLDYLLALSKSSNAYYSSYSYNRELSLPSFALNDLIPRMAATGRMMWGLNAQPPIKPGDLSPVVWDGGAPFRLQVEILADDARQSWRLMGHVVREGETVGLPLDSAVLANEQVVLWPDRLARMDAEGQTPWLDLFRRLKQLEIPYADKKAFLSQLIGLPSLPNVRWPENLQVEEISGAPRAYLRVFKPKYAYGDELHATLSFDYGSMRIPSGNTRDKLFQEQEQRVVVRDRDAEERLANALLSCGAKANRYPHYRTESPYDFTLTSKQLPDIVAALSGDQWTIEAEGLQLRRPGKFSMSVTSGVDWFELEGHCDFDGKLVALPEILAAARKGERFIRLGDGSQGILPQEWLNKYGKFIELAEEKGGKLQFKPTQAMLLDALLAEQGTVNVDRDFAAYRQKLRSFAGIKAAEPPASFTGDLRPYQRDGLGWLEFLKEFQFGGCLADDMGLGKTVQVLALLEERRTRKLDKGEQRLPSLVVVPRSLIFNWQNEAAKFAPQLGVLDFSGTTRKGMWERIAENDVVLMTYGTLIRDIIKLKDQPFDYAILDEAQAIKNSNSQSAKACRLLNARHRLALTGTPIENHLGELWSLIEFLNPGMLGKFTAFAKLADGGKSPEGGAEGRMLISKAVQPIILRRTKQQVLKDLPEKTEQTIVCELSAAERKKYNEIRDFYRASLNQQIDEAGLEKSKIHVLEALLRLRQSACHLGLLDNKLKSGSSAKLDVLLEQVEELIAENHKALIFSQFTELLAIVRQHFDKRGLTYEYLDGKTRDRQKRVNRFQNDPQCPLFLVSLKAGGRGLNLTAADYVFILDPWWNPAVEAQAVDRAHRLGQTKPVFAYRLIAKDTVEEKILELQKTKRDLADSIISEDSSVLKNLTAEDLKLLLS
jgi:superfamily II DNA or RNA helicase